MRIGLKAGFTLIELLIVVAIIAILAAIAVPNFLEAQTRSKVSRVHADMRTYATAIEAYAVDNNMPPPGYWSRNRGWGITPYTHWTLYKAVFNPLTTPIAYMTTIPLDPFATNIQRTNMQGDPSGGFNTPYWYQDYILVQKAPTSGNIVQRLMLTLNMEGYSWSLHSWGPYKQEIEVLNTLTGAAGPNHCSYDPTNGTISRGGIIRTNKGVFEAPQNPWSGFPPGV